MPHAKEMPDWHDELVLSRLELGDHIRKSAEAYAHEMQCEYGRRWAQALEVYSRDELLERGYEEPTVQCGRDPDKLKAMVSRTHPGYGPPETHPSLLDVAEGD